MTSSLLVRYVPKLGHLKSLSLSKARVLSSLVKYLEGKLVRQQVRNNRKFVGYAFNVY